MEDQDDDYWGTSNVTKNRARANVFDDKVSFEATSDLANLRKSLNSPEEEVVEIVNWDDTPVTRPSSKRQASQARVKLDSRDDLKIRNSSVHFQAGEKQAYTSEWNDGPSIDAIVKDNDPHPVIGKRKLTKHEEEIDFLCTELERAKRTVVNKLSLKETVNHMIQGQPYSLEQYKSLEEKQDLLKYTIETHDGNAIIAAVIFLKRTVKDQIFNLELRRYPDAISQYLCYLKAHYLLEELEKVLGMLNRYEEHAMLKYKQASSVTDAAVKIERLKKCFAAHFKNCDDPQLEHDGSMIQQQVDLLQLQRPVDASDVMEQSSGRPGIFKEHPRVTSIINMPVLTTLYYCSFYHYNEPENQFASPLVLRNQHQLTDKQYLWNTIRARARLRKWNEIETLLTTKGWFGSTKMKSAIGFDKVADIIQKSSAPMKEVSKYLMLMDDVDKRLVQAKKMRCHDAIIETYKAQKDKRSLEAYVDSLKPQSQEWFYAKDVLKSSTIKWKT